MTVLAAGPVCSAESIEFWDRPQRGANSFNESPPDAEYFKALRDYGATWVRIAFSKWPSTTRDFLLGDADRYEGLNVEDLTTLKDVLDRAHDAGLKVVVTPLSLPGARWIQHNGGVFDDRIWADRKYWRQSAEFWRDLARELKGHPAIAAYNLVNEPAPERRGGLEEGAEVETMRAWYERQGGGARDLPALYASIVAEIRSVDPETPIMLDAGFYAATFAYRYWPAPLADPSILYAYHMYEPWSATSAANLKRKDPYAYPGTAVFGGREEQWDARRIAAFLRYPIEWARKHDVPANRMVAAEFGCMRVWPSCPRYLEDVLSGLEADGVHWAFYAFREDAWDGMDYELGAEKLPWQYWEALEAGERYELKRGPNPVFEPILRRLRNVEPVLHYLSRHQLREHHGHNSR